MPIAHSSSERVLSMQEAEASLQVAIVGIFRETVSTVFRFKARNGYDKISRSKARAL